MFYKPGAVSDVESMSAAEVTKALVAASNDCKRMFETFVGMCAGVRAEQDHSNEFGMSLSRG